MNDLEIWQFRVSRLLGRGITRLAAALTLYRMPPFVSTSAIVADRDRVLTVIDPIRDEPILPGGHLKWRESPLDAVVREVEEETGLRIVPHALLTAVAGRRWAGEDGVVRIVYTAHVVGGVLSSSAEGEACWTAIDHLAGSDTRDAPLIRLWLERETATASP